MSYERYKTIMSRDEFFSDWNPDNLSQMDFDTKNSVYFKYLLKCEVFQRDDFKCQNDGCEFNSELTLHHIKFRKNNGKDKLKNSVTICKTCHQAYHRGKKDLTFFGMTYRLHKEEGGIDWKIHKKKARQLRKSLKQVCGYKISWEMLRMLMRFLEKEYTELLEEDMYDD